MNFGQGEAGLGAWPRAKSSPCRRVLHRLQGVDAHRFGRVADDRAGVLRRHAQRRRRDQPHNAGMRRIRAFMVSSSGECYPETGLGRFQFPACGGNVMADQDERKTRADAPDDRFFAISIDMLCFMDFNGFFKRLNPAWERTLGFTLEELRARPAIEFVHPDDRERTLAQNGQVKTGAQALGFENRYLCKDGSYRWLLWNAAPDFDQQVIYSVARDITERKRAEEEREALVLELQAALREVRTPAADPADLLVLQEHPQRRELLGNRRGLHRRAHQHAVQPQHLSGLLPEGSRTAVQEMTGANVRRAGLQPCHEAPLKRCPTYARAPSASWARTSATCSRSRGGRSPSAACR
jgi:PAS domain S-box-containing protein